MRHLTEKLCSETKSLNLIIYILSNFFYIKITFINTQRGGIMKWFFNFAFALGILALAIISCTGPEGPAGPPGKDGSPGTAVCGVCHESSSFLLAKQMQFHNSLH
jgi:hypothetical protein